jgi:prevent-host-death family protein
MARNDQPTGRGGEDPRGESESVRSGRSDGARKRTPGRQAAKGQASVASGRAARSPSPSWKLEDAKAKFSEVVRRAHDEGPQYVTVRGKRAVAIIDAAELERLLPVEQAPLPFVEFLESLYVEGLDLDRDADVGRDVDL